MNESVLLVGAGKMAIEYTRVLQALHVRTTVIGRNAATAQAFQRATGVAAAEGGLQQWLDLRTKPLPPIAFVAVSINQLAATTSALIAAGVRRILVEKPAGVNDAELQHLSTLAQRSGADIRVAYNRRFLASTFAAKNACDADGGLLSMHFEFTEWTSRISQGSHPPEVLSNWMLANSSHVIDLALFLGGSPQQLTSFVSRGLSWHPQASVFSGAGVTDRGALFSYHANWESAGRWGIELRTSKRRLLLCPLEQLQEQKRDSVEITPVEIDDHLDRQFKPGFYLQTKAMLSGSSIELLPTIQEHAERNARVYLQIVSGSPDEFPQAATTRRVA